MKKTIDDYIHKRTVMPLLSWDIFYQFYSNMPFYSNKIDEEITELSYFSSKFKWKDNIESILKNNNYEALVLTDADKKILWVNNGFSKMTGYSKKYAINKKPAFLQGENSEEKREIIRKKLTKGLPFKEIILNYKKNGSAYNCELYIIPLKTKSTTYYLALETAV